MSGRKRYPSTQLSISDIYKGIFKSFRDQKYFELDGIDIPKVNVFGVVVDKFDGTTQNGRKFATITIDDGTDTIRVKVWSRPTKDDDGKVIRDPYNLLVGIELGHIVDVIGKVREYGGEYYLDPYSTSATDDIEWEIHRRIQVAQSYLDEQDLLLEDKDMFEKQRKLQGTQYQNQSSETQPVQENEEITENPAETESLHRDLITQAFSEDIEENTIEKLAVRTKLSPEIVKSMIEMMWNEGEIYQPLPDRFDLIPL